MADDPTKRIPRNGDGVGNSDAVGDETRRRGDRGEEEEVTSPGEPERDRTLGDLVRRAVSVGVGAAAGAVSAGVGVAASAKDDIVRVAAAEMRNWLEKLNLQEEMAKALTKMVIEVKTEIRFRPNDEGKLVPETSNDVKVKPGK
jgi:hypothetical protein